MSDSNGMIQLTIDGRDIAVEPKKKFYDAVQQREFTVDTTIYDAAQKLGIDIPIPPSPNSSRKHPGRGNHRRGQMAPEQGAGQE